MRVWGFLAVCHVGLAGGGFRLRRGMLRVPLVGLRPTLPRTRRPCGRHSRPLPPLLPNGVKLHEGVGEGGRLVSRPVGKPGTARSVALRFAARTLCVPQRSGPAAHSHCKNFDGPGDFRTWLALAGWSQWTCVRAVACFLLVSGVCGCVCGGALPEPGVPIQSVPPARAEIPVGAHLLNCV